MLLHTCSLLFLPATPDCQTTVFKGSSVEIPPMSDTRDGDWGLPDRTADHATVAINDDGDVLVVYHTERTGYQSTTYGLRQVEAALFEYDSTLDSWQLTNRYLLGDVRYDTLGVGFSPVKCERPDVVAIGSGFFVTWTRRYDRSFQFEEPAVLECAWLAEVSGNYIVYNNGATSGIGVKLADGYYVRECAGVPDAVLLDPGVAGAPKSVGVAFVEQTKFGDDANSTPPYDALRLCNLRFVVCEINSGHALSIPSPVVDLVTGIKFNGDTSPSAGDSAGLVLPDCAPTSTNFRFWFAYEEQLSQSGLNPPDGRIRLKLFERTPLGTWDELTGRSFGSSSLLAARRRPNLSSYPPDSGGLDLVSIAFSKSEVNGNGDVVYEHWVHDSSNGLYKAATPPSIGFPNDPGGVIVDDSHPIPVLGRNLPMIRRCYVDLSDTGKRILRHDQQTNQIVDLTGAGTGIGRPAVSCWLNPHLQRDDVAVTWEQIVGGSPGYKRIFLRLD